MPLPPQVDPTVTGSDWEPIAEFRRVAALANSSVSTTSDRAIRELLNEAGWERNAIRAAARVTRTRSMSAATAVLRAERDTGTGPIHELFDLGRQRFDHAGPIERLAWTALSIFTADFSLTHATLVLTSSGIDMPEEVLDELVGARVLLAAPHGDDLRFHLPAVYRAASRDAVAQKPAIRIAARSALRSWWLERARTVDRDWFGSGQKTLFQDVSADLASLKSLLADATDVEAGELVEILALLEPYWSSSTQIDVAIPALDALIRTPRLSPEQKFRGLWALAWLVSSVDALRAETYLAEATELLPEVETTVPEARARLARVHGMCALYRGAAGDAQTLFETALEYDSRESTDGEIFMDLSFLASAASLAGNHTVAYDFCERAIAMCERRGETWLKNYTLWAFALTAWRDGDSHRAYVLALDSLDAAIDMDDPYAGAIALEIAGWYHVLQGNAELAATLLGIADNLRIEIRIPTLFWGTKDPHDAAIRDAVDQLGPDAFRRAFRGVRQATMSDALTWLEKGAPSEEISSGTGAAPRTLTPRQREIADLISEGKTNKEIARLLLITVRTVEAHIEHIFAKLEVSSRAQIAAWSVRATLK